MSYIKINDCKILCAGTASPSDLHFDIKELAGKTIRWSIGDAPVADAIARTPPGGIVIEVANAGVADDWFMAIRVANGEPVPTHWRSWRPDPPDPEAVLLEVLYKWIAEAALANGRGPEDVAFDASSVSFAVDDPALLDALAFLRPELNQRKYSVGLDEASRKRIDDWLWKMDGRTLAGYRLRRDEFGWVRIERVTQ